MNELYKMNNGKYWRAAHRKAILQTLDDQYVKVDVALFDSGASSDIYISTELLHKHVTVF